MKRKNYLIKTLIAGIFVGEIIFFAGCFGDVEWFALFGCITMLISLALLIVFVIVKVIKKLLCRFSSKQNEASTGNAEVATQSNDSIGETITEKSDSECSEWATAFLASSFISALSEVLSSDLDLALFVAYDEDFNDRFPFIDTDGFIEVCTYREEAEKLKSHYLEHHLGHISIREITGNHKILETFKSYLEMGIRHMRFHHYDDPMEICLTNIVNPDSNNLLEIRNVSTRAQFLRELQYAYRLRKLDISQKGGSTEKSLNEFMEIMQLNAYRSFGSNLCYVLNSAPYSAGTTLYTPKALAKAKAMLSGTNLPESALIADGDNSYAVYDSDVKLQITQGREQSQVFVCAFTGRKEAEMVRTLFLNYGVNDSVLVITFDELCYHAKQCAGVLIDMPTYGRQLMNDELEKVQHLLILPPGEFIFRMY